MQLFEIHTNPNEFAWLKDLKPEQVAAIIKRRKLTPNEAKEMARLRARRWYDNNKRSNKKSRNKLKSAYYKEVWAITESQPLYTLTNHEKRHFKGYHLDHIIPISYGFKNELPADVIGHISNLQFIPYKENMLKSARYTHIR